jgi:hypothetical protein
MFVHVTLGSKLLSYETRRVTFSDRTMTRLLSSVSHKIQTSSALKAISRAEFSVSSVVYTEVVKKLSLFSYEGQAKEDFKVRTVQTLRHSTLGQQRAHSTSRSGSEKALPNM